jgi:hypothetical protein
MSKPLVLSHAQWSRLKTQLTLDYSQGVMMISWRMKDKLGFTVREYQAWKEVGAKWNPTSDIRLDFYNDSKRTMFLLKYSEYLSNTDLLSS